jgi:hypothetical protein
MDNQKLATLRTQDEDIQSKNTTQYVLDTQAYTNKCIVYCSIKFIITLHVRNFHYN